MFPGELSRDAGSVKDRLFSAPEHDAFMIRVFRPCVRRRGAKLRRFVVACAETLLAFHLSPAWSAAGIQLRLLSIVNDRTLRFPLIMQRLREADMMLIEPRSDLVRNKLARNVLAAVQLSAVVAYWIN